MPVATRIRNKQAHPGAPDLASPSRSQSQRNPSKKKPTQEVPADVQQAVIDKVAALEKRLLTRDADNPSKPPGPAVTKKSRTVSATAQALKKLGLNSTSMYPFLT
jgi:hypothetical protein